MYFSYMRILVFIVIFNYGNNVYCQIPLQSKWAVSFATIPPRFHICNETVRSLFLQTLKPEFVIIFVATGWDHKRVNRNISFGTTSQLGFEHSNAQMLRNILEAYFPLYIRSGKLTVVELPRDYGPATKFVGVLLSFSYFPVDYWVICDDDNIYDSNLFKLYEIAFDEYSRKTRIHGPVLTTFDALHSIFRIIAYGTSYLVPQIQGADSYVIPTAVLYHQRKHNLLLSYSKFLIFLEHMFLACYESYYNDDFLISFAFRLARVQIRSLWKGKISYIPNHQNDSSEMHLNASANYYRRNVTKVCIQRETMAIVRLLGIRRGL